MDPFRLTPLDVAEHPAMGILMVVREGLRMAHLALYATHADLLLEEELISRDPHAAAAAAYAMALLAQMRALEDTIQSYRFSLQNSRRHEMLEEEPEDDPVF